MKLVETNISLKQSLDKINISGFNNLLSEESIKAENVGEFQLITKKLQAIDSSELRAFADKLRKKEDNIVTVLISILDDKAPLVVALSKEINQLDARDIMEHIVNQLGGSGGGRRDLAQGGIDKVEDVDILLASLSDLLLSLSN